MCKVMQQENEFKPELDETCTIFKKQISAVSVQQVEAVREQIAAYDGNKQGAFQYRCYVGKGNNQMMVRALFKNRFWWLF